MTTKTRPQYQELHALLFTISMWVLLRPLLTITSKMQETGPTVYEVTVYEVLIIVLIV